MLFVPGVGVGQRRGTEDALVEVLRRVLVVDLGGVPVAELVIVIHLKRKSTLLAAFTVMRWF